MNGQPQDPATHLLGHLAVHFAPLGEEARMALECIIGLAGAEATDCVVCVFLRDAPGGRGWPSPEAAWHGATSPPPLAMGSRTKRSRRRRPR